MIVENPTQYLDVIEQLSSKRPGTLLWFRGQARIDWSLRPAAFRGFSFQQEVAFYRDFRLKAPPRMLETPKDADLHRWITLMRHHGLPTRLLDWTTGALIALYFAVSSEIESDGAVFVLDPYALNLRYLGEALVRYLGSSTILPILRPPFMQETDLPDGKIAAVIMEENNLRMLMQQGCFTIHTGQYELDIKQHKECVARIAVARRAKKKIAKSLSLNGIRRSSLFPDLDGLAADLVEDNYQ